MRRIALALALALAAPAAAEEIVFDITLAGLRVATLVLDGTVTGDRYRVTGTIRTTGVGAIRRVLWQAQAEGRVQGGSLRTLRYAEQVEIGPRRSATTVDWSGGVPVVTVTGEPREAGTPADPAGQAEAVDPLTAMFAGMRDVPQAGACRLSLQVFDGQRATRARLSGPVAAEGVTCTGLYTRLAGFADREMADRTRFPFTATFVPAGDGTLRLMELRTPTVVGSAVLERR